jgi:chromosome segregation ATPase
MKEASQQSAATMESLPEPSDTVDDEWASMKIRFNKEGLVWDKLTQEDRLLQVWRWMSDSETNLRTLRIKTEKNANLRNNEREELEEQIDKYAKKIFELENENKTLENVHNEMSEEVNTLQARNIEVEEDNRNLAYELKHALKEVEQMDYDEGQGDDEANDDEMLETKILDLENRIEDISLRHQETKFKYKEKLSLQKMDFEHKIEELERDLKMFKLELETGFVTPRHLFQGISWPSLSVHCMHFLIVFPNLPNDQVQLEVSQIQFQVQV